MTTLQNKTILVIGGTSGIGFSVAKVSLLTLAARVVVASSSEAKVKGAVERLEIIVSENDLPGKVEGRTVDASNVEAVKQFMIGIGEIDHLVYTSGDYFMKNFEVPDVGLDDLKGTFNVRFWGAVAAVQAAKFRPGGSAVLTGGVAMFKPLKNWSVPAGIIGAVDTVVRGLAIDLAPVRVNSVCPGIIDTELFQILAEEGRDAIFEKSRTTLPVKHVGTPDECAEAYIFLMKCGYITGQRIVVDGGHLLI